MKTYLTYEERKISNISFSNYAFIIMCIIPFFKTMYYDKIPFLSDICNILISIEFIVFLVICIARKYFSKFCISIIFFEIWVYVCAPLITGNQTPSLYYLFQSVAALCFFETGINTNPRKVMNIFSVAFIVFSLLNLIIQQVPSLQIKTEDEEIILLFGLRTGISLFVIPGILFNLLRDRYVGKTSIRTILMFAVASLSLIYDKVATGLMELLIIILLLLIMRKRIAEKINFGYLLIVIILFDIIFTIGSNHFMFIDTVASWFDKDTTLSGRTNIWALVVRKLADSPIAGFGADSVVQIGSTYRSAHNQWLHFALEGGYVALVLFIIAVVIVLFQIQKGKGKTWYISYCICMIAIIIGTITEIQTYVPFFYLILDMPFLLDKYYAQEAV